MQACQWLVVTQRCLRLWQQWRLQRLWPWTCRQQRRGRPCSSCWCRTPGRTSALPSRMSRDIRREAPDRAAEIHGLRQRASNGCQGLLHWKLVRLHRELRYVSLSEAHMEGQGLVTCIKSLTR